MGLLMPDAGKILWAVLGAIAVTKILPKLKG